MRKLRHLFPRFFGKMVDLAQRAALEAFRSSNQKRVFRTIGDGFETLESRVVPSITITQANVSKYWTDGNFSAMDPKSITIDSGVVINTLNSTTGNAGTITLNAPSITINANAQLLADGATDAQDGDISIIADNLHNSIGINAFMQLEDIVEAFGNQLKSSITIGAGTVIKGGTVTITAESGDPFKFSNTTTMLLQPMGKVLAEAIHKPDLASLPLAIQVWQPSASIEMSGSIISSGDAEITSQADANASGKAVFNRVLTPGTFDGGGLLGAALGYFQTDATATIEMMGTATIQSGAKVSLETTVDNAIQLEVMTSKNNGITQTNPKAIGVSLGTTLLNTISTILVSSGAIIKADGVVNIAAEATDENELDVITNLYRDGTAGIAIGFAYTNATVQAIVEGTVTSGWVPPSSGLVNTVSFNPSLTVDFATSSLGFPSPVSFTTGSPVLFQSVDGATVPGLVPGTVYYAIANSTNPNQLQLATTEENATNGVNINFGAGFPTLTNTNGLAIPITVVDAPVTNAILFGYSTQINGTTPLFVTGQTVTFQPLAGSFLGYNDANGNLIGPLSGSYTVSVVPSPEASLFPMAIQLLDSAGKVVLLNDNSLLTTANGTQVQVYSVDFSASQMILNPPTTNPATGEPFTTPPNAPPSMINGQPLVFTGGLGNPVGNLTNGQTYYAVVNLATPGVINLALTLGQSESANPAIQNAVPTLLTIANQRFISGSTNTFPSNRPLNQTLNANDSYSLWTNSTSGTFTLTVTPPQGAATTTALAYNATPAEVATAINAISGMVVSVSGNGSNNDPWIISGQYQLPVGTFEVGVGLVFDYDPSLADGTAVVYQAVPGKPIEGFTNGSTYYAYNQINANFVPQLPQYVMSLQSTSGTSGTPVDFQLSQSMTDGAGQNYFLSGANVNEGQILLELPQTALVNSVNSGGLFGGTGSSAIVSAGALQFFSFATSGTFTISVDTSTGTETTLPIVFNASAAAVEAALNALTGVNVSVRGTGQISSPWTLVGLNYDTVTMDCGLLQDETYQTNILFKELQSSESQVWTTATSGTFTLTFNVNGQNQTTSAIAFDATPTDLVNALNALPKVRASVTGAGTLENPWQITTGYQSIQTGDALIFNDSWNMPSLGMMDGQTYYAVVSGNQYQPQTLVLSLADSVANATATEAIILNMQPNMVFTSVMDNTMTGASVSLTEPSSDISGINISATLTSTDWVTVESNIGLFPMLAYVSASYGHGHWQHPFEAKDNVLAIEKNIKHHIPAGQDIPNSFESTAAPAVVVVKNSVLALVGETAVLTANGTVAITSTIDEILHSQSNATICKSRTGFTDKGEPTDMAVAIAFNGAFVDNSSQAIIASNAQVSGAGGVSVVSDIFYPFIIKETNLSQLINGDGELTSQQKTADSLGVIEKVIGNALFSANLGISKWLFNNTANVASVPGDDGGVNGIDKKLDPELAWTISGAVSVIDITNTNLAQIADGAQINQSPLFVPLADQLVTVEANTALVQTGVVGEVYLGLSLSWLIYGLKTDTMGTAMFEQNSGGTSLGGSFNYMSLANSTQALLGGEYSYAPPNNGISGISPYAGTPFPSTKVNYGTGGLTVEANTFVTVVLLSQAGGKSSHLGIDGSFVVLDMGEQGSSPKKQLTLAQLISVNLPLVISANAGTTGTLEVKATDTSDLWVMSGATLSGGPKAIGFSGSQVELTRDISASVGTSASTNTPTQASTFNTNGAFEVLAAASGSINPTSLVGEYAPNGKSVANAAASGGANVAQAGAANAASDIHGKWGWAVSGDYSAALINDSVNAWVSDNGTFTGQAGNQLIVEATNTTIAHATSGSAAIVNAHGNTGPTVGISGSASVVVYESTVEALIAFATMHNYSVELIADNGKKVGSFSGGMQVSVVTGSDLNLAGSVAFNQITNDTQATLQNVTAYDLEEVTITATSADQVWAAAGMLTITWGKRDLADPANSEKPKTVIGVGVSGAMNTLINTTYATVRDCEFENLEGAMDISAEDFSHSFVFSAGVDITVPAGTAVELGGMWSTTNIAPDTQALITGSTILGVSGSHPTNLELIAAFIPVAISFAGYVALEANKPLSVKETKIGVGVGAGVIVTNIGKNGSNLAQTVAQIVDSEINLPEGELTIESYSGKQSAAPSGIVSPLSELPDPDGNNIWSLAIAGSAQGESSDDGTAVSDGVAGALIFTTLDINTDATINTSGAESSSVTSDNLTLSATENFLVYSDAGGVTVAAQISDEAGVGVAVGGAFNKYTSTNTVKAIVNNANITSDSLAVESVLAPNVTSIAFGVAVDVAAAAEIGVSVSLSGASGPIGATDTVVASITGGAITVNGGAPTDTLTVSSLDQSNYQVSRGAGSLSIAAGSAAVAIAPSEATSTVTITNTVQAFIGSQTENPAVPTTLFANVPVSIEATCEQDISTTVIAVAVSVAASEAGVAFSGGGASSSITTGNTVAAGLLYGATLSSTWTGSPPVIGSTDGLAISALQHSSLNASVGAGALSVGLVGGSLGISLAEITTIDSVTAAISGASVITSGTAVSVEATGTSSLSTMSVPTALSASIGVAGAGGNSNITDSSTFTASVDTGSNISTGNSVGVFGDLTVVSSSQDTLLAQIFGGAAGVGSIGVFMSDTEFSGSSTAQLSNAGDITIGDLVLQATGNHTLTSDGYSITLGGLAGTGETHRLTYSETINATIIESGSTPEQISANGSATINAQSNTTAIARDSGQKPNSQAQTSYTIAGLGVGVYQAVSTFTPTVTTTITNVNLQVTDTLSISATVNGSNTAQAMAGSGAIYSAEASKAETTNSPTVTLTVGSSILNAASIALQAATNMTYDAYADSVNVSLAGGGGTVVTNTSSPTAEINLNSQTTLTSTGQIDISSQNSFQRATLSNEVNGYMVRVGAGGVITGYGGIINSTFNPTSTVTIAPNVSISSNGTVGGNPSGISIIASQKAQMQEMANLNTGGLLVSLDWNTTSQTSTVTTSVTIGTNATLVAAAGPIAIGTIVNIDAVTTASTTTWGLGGNATSSATSDWTVNQAVSVGTGTTIFALGDVSIVAGENPINGQISTINTMAIANSRTRGLYDIPMASTPNCALKATSTLNLDATTATQTAGNVYLGANPGNNSGTAYWRTQYDANFIHYDLSSVLTNTGTATLNGVVEAGVDYQLDIVVNPSGDALTINGGSSIPLNANTSFVNQSITSPATTPVVPGNCFYPFQAAYNTNYLPNPGTALDPATAAILSSSLSQTPVNALQLSGLVAQGGEIVVKANTVAGNATLSAYSPLITITNPSANYLILDGVSIPSGRTVGQITLLGATSKAPSQGSLTYGGNADGAAKPTIVVNQSYPSAVGTGTTSGPAVLIEGYFNNPSGDVTLTNAMGAIIEIAPINAASVTISSPNSAFVLSTPTAYYGVGGNSIDAWALTGQPASQTNSTSYIPTYTIPSYAYAFIPGQTNTGAWNANLAATAAADYLFNGVSISNGPDARQLISSTLSLNTFAQNSFYNDGYSKGNKPSSDTHASGSSTILFGNSTPWADFDESSNTAGADTQSDQEYASFMGSGGILANASPNWYQFGNTYYDTGANGGAVPLVLPDQPILAQAQVSAISPYLTGGLTAAQVSLTALLIDVNAPLNVGISKNINIHLTASLGTTLTQFQANFQNGTVTSPLYSIPASYLGAGASGFTATYNAQTNQITLSSIASTSGQVSALLVGQIISTTTWGKINMIGGPGLASINNGTGIPLVLEGIDSGSTEVVGTIEIKDSLKQLNTKYVYQPGQGLVIYTAPSDQPYPTTSSSSSSSATTSYAPVTGALYSQTSSADIWRGVNLGGRNANTTFGTGFWNFGQQVVGSSGFTGSEDPNGQYWYGPTGTSWTYSDAGIQSNGSAFGAATAPDGDGYSAFIQTGSISQSVYLVPGNYTVSFQAANRSGYSINPIQVSINGQNLGAPINPNSTSWTQYSTQSATYSVTTTGFYNLVLAGTNAGTGTNQGNVFVDDVLLTWSPSAAVPSPFTSTPGGVVLAKGSTIPTNSNVPLSQVTMPTGYEFMEYLVAAQTSTGYTAFEFDPSGNGAPWGMGNNTRWTYNYPTGYSLELYSYLKADNAIAIDFGAMQMGELSVNSNAGIVLNGSIQFGGNVSLNSIGDISQNAQSEIEAWGVQLVAQQGSLGTNQTPLSISTTPGFTLSAFGEEGVYLSSPGDLLIDDISTSPLEIDGFTRGTTDWSLVNGVAPIVGFSEFESTNMLIDDNSLQLTDGVNDFASSAWYRDKVSTSSFTAQFTYTASGNRAADGITFAFQNYSPFVLGNDGGALGYTGIIGQTVAYEMNIYDGHQVGTNFISNNYTGTYNPTGDVNIASGDPIDVTLVYDEIAQTLTETLTDSVTQATYTNTYSGIRLEALLGTTSYIGFTGGDGGATSIQTITNFQFQSNLPQIVGNSIIMVPPGVDSQLSAAWYKTPVSVTSGFEASFVYQANGQNPADGMALVFQNEGLNSIGGDGSSLGYSGISNNQNTAAFEINIFDGHTIGTNFVTNGESGNYNTTGAVNVASGHEILVNLNYDQATHTLYESLTDLDTGATYSTSYNINLQTVLNATAAYIGFTAADGGAFASQTVSNFRFGYVAAATAEVVVTSNGNISGANNSSVIRGSNITLNSTTGSIGTSSQAMLLDLNPQTLSNGTVIGGVFNATASGNIYAAQATGDMRVGSIIATGTVSLTTLEGSIVDGLSPDSSGLNSSDLTKANREKIIKILQQDTANSGTNTVTVYEGMIDRNYTQYWNLVPYGTVQNGVFVVNPDDIAQLALTYNCSDAQVQTWANNTWQQCVSSFENTLAFGPTWATLPQFAAYDPTYIFIASSSTAAQLNAGSLSAFGILSGISLDALKAENAPGSALANVNIQAGNLILSSAGSVGISMTPVIIPMADINNRTLTIEQKELMALATQAGEIKMVGTNVFGVTQLYYYGSPPTGIIPTGVQIIISRPLFVNVASGGTVIVQAGDAVLLTETTGNMNLISVTAPGTVRLTAEGSILSANPTSTIPTVSSANLFLVSNGQIGSGSSSLAIAATGRVDARATLDLALNQVSGNLNLGQLISGGAVSLQAAGSIVNGQTQERDSLVGFGGNGTGWTPTSVNGQVAIANNELTFTNQIAPVNPNSTWPSNNELWLNTSVGLSSDFVFNFLYQSTGEECGLVLTMKNPLANLVATNPSADTPLGTVSFVLNLGNESANSQSAGFAYTRTTGPDYVPQSVGQIDLNAGNLIQVTLLYSLFQKTWTSILTDTVTGSTTTLVQTDFDLLQLLGADKVQIGFSSFASGNSLSTQLVTDFSLVDGAANLRGGSLNAVAGGSFGSVNSPITMLVLNEVNITAPTEIYATQLFGDMYTGTIISNGVVSLSAPQGSVLVYTPPAPTSKQVKAPSSQSTLTGSEIQLNALFGVGTKAKPLNLVTGNIAVRSRLGDIALNNSGEVNLVPGIGGHGLFAGGAISLANDATIHVQAAITAGLTASIQAQSSSGGTAKVLLESGASIIAHAGAVSLFGNDGIETAPNSTIQSHGSPSQVILATGTPTSPSSAQPTTKLLGKILAGALEVHGGTPDQKAHLAISKFDSLNQTPMAVSVAGYQSLHIDDSLFTDPRSFTLENHTLSTSTMEMALATIGSVLLDLGSQNDQVEVGGNTGLNKVTVRGNQGADQLFVKFADKLLKDISFEGGPGYDSLVTDTLGANAWASLGVIQTLDTRIGQADLEHLEINGCSVLNGLPIPIQSFDSARLGGSSISQQFVQTVFGQVLERAPMALGLDQRTKALDTHTVTRLTMATEVGKSQEAYTLLVNAWYKNYLGRSPKPAELSQSLFGLRTNQSETEVLSKILAGTEFEKRMNAMQKEKTSAERFIVGLYKLAVNPSGTPTKDALTSLLNMERTQGRAAVASTMLKSSQYLANQAEALSIQINQKPSDSRLVAERKELGSSTEMRSLLLSRIWNDTPTLKTNQPQWARFTEGHKPVLISGNIRLNDGDGPRNFNQGTLTVTVQSNATAEDRLSIANQGRGVGQIGITGNQVTYSNVKIGTFQGGQGATPLVIKLNGNATQVATQTLLGNILFATVGDNPSPLPRSIRFVLNDGTNSPNAESLPLITRVQVKVVNDKPVIKASAGTTTYKKDGAPILIDNAITVADVDNRHFAKGELSIALIANGTEADCLGIKQGGGIAVIGTEVYYGSKKIGTFTGGGAFTQMVIKLSDQATPEAVQDLARNITFENISNTPSTLPRTVSFVLKDGSGGTSTGATRVVKVSGNL